MGAPPITATTPQQGNSTLHAINSENASHGWDTRMALAVDHAGRMRAAGVGAPRHVVGDIAAGRALRAQIRGGAVTGGAAWAAAGVWQPPQQEAADLAADHLDTHGALN
jgi:hypothetical protein